MRYRRHDVEHARYQSGRTVCGRFAQVSCIVAFAAAVTLTACGGDGVTPVDPPTADRWAAVDSVTQAMIAANPSYNRFTVSVYNASNQRVYERSYGGFSPTQEVAIASASKWIAGVVLLDVVARGELSLTSTTGQLLGWTGQAGMITLRHLLSFTSGLREEAACTLSAFSTLEACVASIAQQAMVAATPALFDEQAREPYPSVVIGSSPAQSQGWAFRYGLAVWLQCGTPATGCASLSSPGAFGFTPWINRSAGYYATIAMEAVIGSGAAFGTALSVLLDPHIRTALAAR